MCHRVITNPHHNIERSVQIIDTVYQASVMNDRLSCLIEHSVCSGGIHVRHLSSHVTIVQEGCHDGSSIVDMIVRVVFGASCDILHHPMNHDAADGAIRRGNRLKKRVQIVNGLGSNHSRKFVRRQQHAGSSEIARLPWYSASNIFESFLVCMTFSELGLVVNDASRLPPFSSINDRRSSSDFGSSKRPPSLIGNSFFPGSHAEASHTPLGPYSTGCPTCRRRQSEATYTGSQTEKSWEHYSKKEQQSSQDSVGYR